MKILINENSNCEEMEIVINCRETDAQVLSILASLRSFQTKFTGEKAGKSYIIEPIDICYFESFAKRVFIHTEKEIFETDLKLYEIEEKYAHHGFFRSFKSQIININKISNFSSDFGGRLIVILQNGQKLIVSRQYVPSLKEKLGMK